MIPCVVFDFQTLGALALAAVLIATVYLIYRDIRMIMQMVNDLREEFMMLQMSCQQTADGEEDEENEDDDDDEEEDASSEEADSDEDEAKVEAVGGGSLGQDEVNGDQEEELREDVAGESKVENAKAPPGDDQVLRNLTGTQKGRGRRRSAQLPSMSV